MKCHSCGEKVVRFPLKDKDGKFLWKNLFKMDFMSIALVLVVVAMFLGYKADMNWCLDVQEHPCEFCEQNNCCVGGIVTLYDPDNESQNQPMFDLELESDLKDFKNEDS